MAGKNLRKRKPSSQQNKDNNKKRFSSISHDPFFHNSDSKRRNKFDDEDINSSDDEGEEFDSEGEKEAVAVEEDNEEEITEETPAEKKKRLAEAFLDRMRAREKREEEDEELEDEGARREREGERDSLIAKILQQEQLEESGRMRRAIASRVQKPETTEGFRFLVKHRHPVTAVALSEDDTRGFSASKDGTIFHWDVNSGKTEKYLWPSDEVLKSHGAKDPQGRATKHSKHVLALAVSSDGRYLASGGLDRHVHLWDIRTRQHVQAFPGHKGPVSCLTFRQGTSELFSGSFDRSVKIWNAEDRTYINTLFGHQSEVLTIDSLRKERVLTVGRDRTMHLWKVPEESQLVFRAPASSLECCCFISNDEFLSGSDDGSIEHWNILRKKPVHIIRNAHASLTPINFEQRHNGLSNGHIENDAQDSEKPCSTALSWVSSVAVCRSSDLAASGAGNGSIRLWKIESESKGICPLFELPLVGFVNSLSFAKSGRFLIAGVGQEPRLGRWERNAAARNGVALHRLELS
ncbi:U3 snoRNP-associated protein-like EMB2271 isoform X1 [Olea europaea var. sylvestris]|uniref:U3 snoRNP-associated protein-like EMB2271 isoform X1 n=1 Tax=Olea europaea var. sylvestris TaxID=158386 RepID=UPI000C1D6F3E|nr:U3 snoRNP-associated protein-like EMB2271 isoform X1 [Olea europaea var. sylvestris]